MSDVHDSVVAEVYVARSVPEAYFVKGLLEEAGLKARVVGDYLHATAQGRPAGWRMYPRVWVNAADEVRARRIIAKYDERHETVDADSSPSWQCGQCGERVDGSFDICWNCQSPRLETNKGKPH